MRLSKTHLAIVALIIANIAWGATSPILKWALADVGPFTLAFLRFFIASLILLPFTIHSLHIKKNDIPFIIFLAIIGFNIHIGTLLYGLQTSTSINAPIIGASAPIFLILGAMAYLKERPRWRVIAGTLISLLGIIIIVLRPIVEEGLSGSLIGNSLFLLSTFAFVIYTMLLRRIEHDYKPVALTFWLFAIASIVFLPFSIGESIPNGFLAGLTMRGVLGILYGAIFSSLIAYTCYDYALKYIKASEAGLFLYIPPVIAVFVAVPLLGEKITFPFVLGALLVFAGILIAEAHIRTHHLQSKIKHH